MMKRFLQFALSSLVGILMALATGCVDVPDSGISPPDYNALIRIIYTDPALPTATLSLAHNTGDGKTFGPFNNLPSGAFGSASDYASYKAGSKKIYVNKPDGTPADPDTTTLTLGTETVTSLIVLPRDSSSPARILQIGERSTFQTPGIADYARVRFVNCLASKDTVDVWRIAGTSASGVGSDNLRYARSSAFFNVPRDSVWRFYISRWTGSAAGRGDTVSVTGASNKQFTVVVYDSLSRVKVLRLEDR